MMLYYKTEQVAAAQANMLAHATGKALDDIAEMLGFERETHVIIKTWRGGSLLTNISNNETDEDFRARMFGR